MIEWLEPFVGPAVVAGIVGWASTRVVRRVDELERQHAAMREMLAAQTARIEYLMERLREIADRLAHN